VDWPASSLPAADAPLAIGVVGAEAVRSELQAIVAGRQVHGHPLTVRAISEADPLEGLHAVFVGRDANPAPRARARAWAARSWSSRVAQGREAGSMLNFVPVQGRIRFEAVPGGRAGRAQARLAAARGCRTRADAMTALRLAAGSGTPRIAAPQVDAGRDELDLRGPAPQRQRLAALRDPELPRRLDQRPRSQADLMRSRSRRP
jgi:hypothetical protein